MSRQTFEEWADKEGYAINNGFNQAARDAWQASEASIAARLDSADKAIEAAVHDLLFPASEFGDSVEFRGWRKDVAKAALETIKKELGL